MKQMSLNNTDLIVSDICLGAMTFGGKTDEKESRAIMESAYEAGINFIDTAESYNEGRSEEIVGRFIADKRDRIVLASKVFYPVKEGGDRGLSPSRMRSHLDDTLARLGTDYLDIYYLHQPDHNTPLEDTLRTMEEFLQAGKVRYYAVSNYAAWEIVEMIALADRLGMARPVITQSVYNVITRGIEAELMPMAERFGLSLYIYNPLAGGLLTGKYAMNVVDPKGRLATNEEYKKRYLLRYNLSAVEQLTELAKTQIGRPLLDCALLWAYQRPEVTSLILGVSSLKQFEENLAILTGEQLGEIQIQKMDDLSSALFPRGFEYFRT
jgi:aryl-alcohol dehydrogenase-like predicted oxidoreductase